MFYKKLVGQKVYLSPIDSQHYEKYTEWLNSGTVAIGLGVFHQIIGEETEKKTLGEMIQSKNQKQFAIVTLENDELLGNCGIFSINNVNRSATVGLFIGDSSSRGVGFGTDAMALLLDFAFNYLNLHTINLQLFAFNKLAYTMYKKVGFKEVGRMREKAYLKGKYYDEIIMDITEEDFKRSEFNNHIRLDASDIEI